MASLFFCGQSGIWNMRPYISGEPTSLKMPAEPKLYDLQHILQIHIRTSASAHRHSLIVLFVYKITSAKTFVPADFTGIPGRLGPFLRLPDAQKFMVFTSGSPRKGLTAFSELKFPPFSAPCFCPENLPFSCRKGLVASPRGRFRRLAAALLQRRKGPVATP